MSAIETIAVIHEADRVVEQIGAIAHRLRNPGHSAREQRLADELISITRPLCRALTEQERADR